MKESTARGAAYWVVATLLVLADFGLGAYGGLGCNVGENQTEAGHSAICQVQAAGWLGGSAIVIGFVLAGLMDADWPRWIGVAVALALGLVAAGALP